MTKGTTTVTYTPTEEGQHLVTILHKKQHICLSPYQLTVKKVDPRSAEAPRIIKELAFFGWDVEAANILANMSDDCLFSSLLLFFDCLRRKSWDWRRIETETDGWDETKVTLHEKIFEVGIKGVLMHLMDSQDGNIQCDMMRVFTNLITKGFPLPFSSPFSFFRRFARPAKRLTDDKRRTQSEDHERSGT